MDNNFHKSGTKIWFTIADANWGMYHPKEFETEEEARKVIQDEYQNRSENDGSDEYWRNRKQVVIKHTITKDVLDYKMSNPEKINPSAQLLDIDNLIEQIRQSFADYYASEGCSCCQDVNAHNEAKLKLGKLLNAEMYDDGSGVNWFKYRSEK
jgi:hypothetical protein